MRCGGNVGCALRQQPKEITDAYKATFNAPLGTHTGESSQAHGCIAGTATPIKSVINSIEGNKRRTVTPN